MTDLHLEPPLTLGRVHRRARWLLPVAAVVFVLLGIGAAVDTLPWDEPITEEVVEARGDQRNSIAERVSWFGSTPVVLLVAAGAAAVAFRRCAPTRDRHPRPRPCPPAGRVGPQGARQPGPPQRSTGSWPDGASRTPAAIPSRPALSWGLVPLVVALFTGRRLLWWVTTIAVWTLAVAVALSRVWLGVHWTSDAVGGLLLAVLAVAGAEWLIGAAHHERGCASHSSP